MTPTPCATLGHPGAHYNPHVCRTWCLCGEVVRPGNHVPVAGRAS